MSSLGKHRFGWLATVTAVLSLWLLRTTSITGLTWYAPYLYAFWGVLVLLSAPKRKSLLELVLVALCLRLGCLFAPLVWSDDLYRYLWEGNLVLKGGNPFVTAPDQFAIVDGIREQVNHPHISSVYPPLAQWMFALMALVWYHPTMVQLVGALADTGTVLAIGVWLQKQDSSFKGAWLYALHPLPIIESAWSGHLEAVAVCCLVWGIVGYRRYGTWLLFVGGWLKLYPFVLLGFYRGWRWWQVLGMMVLSVGFMYPFLDVNMFNGLGTYVAHWSYNAPLYQLLYFISPFMARKICLVIAIIGMMVLCWKWWKTSSPIVDVAFYVGCIFIVCSPTVHPWYALWLIVPALMSGHKQRYWMLGLWMSLLPLSYVSLFTIDPTTGSWSPPLWPTVLSYLLPSLIWIYSKYTNRQP